MEHAKSLKLKTKKSSATSIWFYVGGVALAVVVAGVVTQFHDIRRYIKMVRM